MSARPETPGVAVGGRTSRLVDRLDALAGDIAADQRPASRPLDVGDGVLRARLQQRFGSCVAVELPEALRLPFPDAAFDLVVCVDGLQRLHDPAAGLRELARVSSRHLLLSVPHEPFARGAELLAGRHLRHLGSAPAHLQRWTGAGFQRFVSTVVNVRSVATPFPWTVVWATKV